jgi:hypothetical protein
MSTDHPVPVESSAVVAPGDAHPGDAPVDAHIDVHPGDAQALARELAAAYRGMVARYREQLHLPADQAHARAVEAPATTRLSQIRADPERAHWADLSALTERDPEAAAALWRHILAHAGDELASGHRAAAAFSFNARPMDRARFLAVRAALLDEHAAASGLERLLVDTAAQAYTLWTEWLAAHHMRTNAEMQVERHQLKTTGKRQARLLHPVEHAADEAERWQRIFLRTLRQLHDLRRAPALTVQHLGQVNIAQEQTTIALTQEQAGGALGHERGAVALDEPARRRRRRGTR